MKHRGKVLRDASNGNGLISSEGRQFEFMLEKNWKSDAAPKVGMVVEFELAEDGSVQSASAVNESQIAKEQADIAMRVAKEKGLALYKEAAARLGVPVLIAWAAFAISWFFLGTVTISPTPAMSVSVTFWNLLGLVNSPNGMAAIAGGFSGDKGIYALFAIAALAGPAISQFWRHSLAHLGNCLPLVLMLIVSAAFYLALRDSFSQVQQAAAAFGGKEASDMVNSMMAESMKAFHIGVGGVIAAAATCYLAFVGAKRYLVAKAHA